VGMLLVLTAPLPAAGAAQHLCFHPHPEARCSWFVVTEAGVAFSVPADEDPNLTFQTGALANVAEHSAIGGVLFAGVYQNDVRLGVRGRYRHWVTDRLTIDVAPGVLLYNGSRSRRSSTSCRLSSARTPAGSLGRRSVPTRERSRREPR
jgi:hypothetical protein